MPDLTCYKLRNPMGGDIDNLSDLLSEKKADSVKSYGPIEVANGQAELFVAESSVHPPDWAGYLKDGFGEDVRIPMVGGASALVIVRVVRAEVIDHLAFSFGQGRYLLRNDAFERGFGLRTALNVIFEGDDGSEDIDPARLRSIDSKRIGEHVLRSRHQVPDLASLEGLDVNARRDLLRGVTGVPQNESAWGGRITGADALTFSYKAPISELGAISLMILEAHDRKDYEVRFSFVDDARLVFDPVVRTFLEEEVVGALRAGGTSGLEMAPPELIDWERVTRFQYHSEARIKQLRHEIRLSDYLATLKQEQIVALDRDRLRAWRVRALDAEGKTVHEWSVWSCLYGSLKLDGKTYLLEDGDFYEVSTDFLGALDGELAGIAEWTGELPSWTIGWKEEDFNRAAAASSPDYLLLDRKTVKVARQTSAVEVCDVLTADRSWVHVKRKTDGSKGLSHLFFQGFVSAELLLSDPEYRAKVLERIREAEDVRAEAESDSGFYSRFDVVSVDSVSAGDHEIVFAMIGRWDESGLEGLPLFSKMTLREMVQNLKLRGLKVAVKLVEI